MITIRRRPGALPCAIPTRISQRRFPSDQRLRRPPCRGLFDPCHLNGFPVKRVLARTKKKKGRTTRKVARFVAWRRERLLVPITNWPAPCAVMPDWLGVSRPSPRSEVVLAKV